jgi:hypothetical protein
MSREPGVRGRGVGEGACLLTDKEEATGGGEGGGLMTG